MLSICLAYHYSVVWEFKTSNKGKTSFLYLSKRFAEILPYKRWKPRFYRGFHGLHLFCSPFMVEVTGFEPATSASRTQRSTKLSHASSINDRYHITTQLGFQDLICGWMLIPEIFKIRHFYPGTGLIIDIFRRKHTDLEQDFHTKSPKMRKKVRKL